ncbi:MAG: NUDIX domain-containing protein [Candidatus Paceibacterota bacterium]|jgi:8-oxo-dGTP pyrophosphatase MutT (NUDIX family)
MDKEISAGIVIFRKTEEGPKFLILYHGHSYWNFAKGKIENEERSFEAALRETREETGLTQRDLRILKNFRAQERFTFRRGTKQIFKTVIFYMAETNRREIKISDEHDGYGWFSFSDAKKILGKFKDSQKVLKSAYDILYQSRSRRGPQNTQRRSPHVQTSGEVRRTAWGVPGGR